MDGMSVSVNNHNTQSFKLRNIYFSMGNIFELVSAKRHVMFYSFSTDEGG